MSFPDPGTEQSTVTAPLQSTLSADPDMAELVQFFVDDMSERVGTIRTAAETNDLAQLRIVAHQLKGAATGYGFAPISESAAELEKMIDSAEPTSEIQDLAAQVDDLISLCQRATV